MATGPNAAGTPGADATETPVVAGTDLVRRYVRGGRSSFWSSNQDRPSVTALDGVSIAVAAGEFVVIAGPSGSGKSTLLHLLAGLDLPTTGTVELDGLTLSDVSARRRTRLRLEQVGIVFQHFHLLPSLSARANVAVPMIERGWGKRRRRERATALLEQVGLRDRLGHRPGQLSGGEQQRVAIARALANDPVLLVGDEPTGEVDSETGARLIDLFESMADDRAVVIASHDPQVIDAADRVIRLLDGRIRE